MNINMKPIAYIDSPYKNRKDIPRQSVLKENVTGLLKLEKEYKDGIFGYEEGDHIIILFNFHESKNMKMIIKPHGKDEEMGVFKTRSPNRPNGIGLTIVQIEEIDTDKGIIKFNGVDMLDGTPVLDIKPYSSKLNP